MDGQRRTRDARGVMTERSAPCPCGEPLPYDVHCGRLHTGDPAITAEQLMRSRYSAHVKADADYLSRSWQSATRPKQIDLENDIEWRGLVVHRTERGRALDADGVVEFTATYERAGKIVEMREISRFERESGRWVYVDGIRPV